MALVEADPILETRRISPSSLNDLLVCERRWGYSHGVDPEVEKAPPNKWIVHGTALHAGIRAFYDGLDPYEAIDNALVEQVAEGGDRSLADLHVRGAFEAFLDSGVAKFWKPTVQEEELLFEIAGVPAIGFVDARTDDLIVDWKSAGSPWDKKKEKDAWLQATFYAVGTGIRTVRFVVISSEPSYKVKVHELEVSDADVRRLEAMVRVYGPRIQSLNIDDFAPNGALSMNWLCSSKWCDYWDRCPGGGARGGI